MAGSEATSEYRVQIFTPPYLLSGATRPTLTSVPTAMGYNKTYTIAYGGTACIDRVVVMRQSSVTHSSHMVSIVPQGTSRATQFWPADRTCALQAEFACLQKGCRT